MRITYSSSIEKLCNINESFDSGVLRVAYHGANRNGSFISKDTFERSIKTIYNCPIVCNYDRERDEIGSHDYDIVEKDGETKIVNITQPIGVVPESAKYWWERIEDASGVHEYLCIDVIIWKRQEAYDKVKENGITDESMEIRVKSGHIDDESGLFVIDSFEFLAFCLLETAEPCFESASLQLFNADIFRQKYAEMMEEFKKCFQMVNTSIGVDIHQQKCLTEGGENHLEQKMELLSRFGLTLDQLDFDIEPLTLEELEEKLSSYNSGVQDQDPEGAPTNEGGAFSLTGEQFREGLVDALDTVTMETSWGEMCRYIYCDYNPETSEVYCYDMEDWRLYGFSYSMNGDNVVIDFESRKRKKFSIVDFDEGDADLSYQAMFDTVVNASVSAKTTELNTQFNTEKTELEQKYNSASDTINSLNKELEELRQYKQQKESDERSAAEGAVFAMFTDLNGIEAFENLRTNCSDLSIEEIEDKCYAIRGRQVVQNFSNNHQKGVRLPIDKKKPNSDEPYGGLFIEFPPNR